MESILKNHLAASVSGKPPYLAVIHRLDQPVSGILVFGKTKEAAAKLSGEGLRGYPNHTNFSLDDPRVFEEKGCLVAILTDA